MIPPEMTESGSAFVLSDGEPEADCVLSGGAVAEQVEASEQFQAENSSAEAAFEAVDIVALSDVGGQVDQAVNSQSSGNQRPVMAALSDKLPGHTSLSQTSASQRIGRRRRKKKEDPAFSYQVGLLSVSPSNQKQCSLLKFPQIFFEL